MNKSEILLILSKNWGRQNRFHFPQQYHKNIYSNYSQSCSYVYTISTVHNCAPGWPVSVEDRKQLWMNSYLSLRLASGWGCSSAAGQWLQITNTICPAVWSPALNVSIRRNSWLSRLISQVQRLFLIQLIATEVVTAVRWMVRCCTLPGCSVV